MHLNAMKNLSFYGKYIKKQRFLVEMWQLKASFFVKQHQILELKFPLRPTFQLVCAFEKKPNTSDYFTLTESALFYVFMPHSLVDKSSERGQMSVNTEQQAFRDALGIIATVIIVLADNDSFLAAILTRSRWRRGQVLLPHLRPRDAGGSLKARRPEQEETQPPRSTPKQVIFRHCDSSQHLGRRHKMTEQVRHWYWLHVWLEIKSERAHSLVKRKKTVLVAAMLYGKVRDADIKRERKKEKRNMLSCHMTSSCRLLAWGAKTTFCFITAEKQCCDTGDRLRNQVNTSEDGRGKKKAQIVKNTQCKWEEI